MKNLQATLLQIGETLDEHGEEIDNYSRMVNCIRDANVIETVKLIRYDGALWTVKKINGQIYDVSCSDLFKIY